MIELVRNVASLSLTIRGPGDGDGYIAQDPIWLSEGDEIVITHTKDRRLVATVRKEVKHGGAEV